MSCPECHDLAQRIGEMTLKLEELEYTSKELQALNRSLLAGLHDLWRIHQQGIKLYGWPDPVNTTDTAGFCSTTTSTENIP